MSHSTTPFTLLPSPSSDRAIESIRRSSPHSQPPEYNIRRNWPGLFGNSLLIMLQDPQATHVAGYQAFKAMGRQVRRGETGIKVLAPITRREPRLDAAGQPVRDDRGRVLHRTQVVATKPVTVFDVRQTDGPPLPDPKIGEAVLLTGQAPAGLWDRLQDLLGERGFHVHRGADLGGANGYTDFGQRLAAFIALELGAELSADDVRDLVRSQRARHCVPRENHLVQHVGFYECNDTFHDAFLLCCF